MKKRKVEEIFVDSLLSLSNRMSMDKITVKKIVEESGLSQQTFYNYYKDKSDLILSVHKVYGQMLVDKLENGEISQEELLIENNKFYDENKDFMLNVLKNDKDNNSYFISSAENAYDVLYKCILKRKGINKLNKDIDFYLRMYTYSSVFMYAYWAENMTDTSIEEFASYLENSVPEKLSYYFE